MDTLEGKRTLTRILVHLILILVSITMLTPFLWMTLTAFKTTTEATSVNPFVILPSHWRTDAFSAVITYMDFGRLYWNTILMIFFRVLLAVVTASTAGYAFARLRFPGKEIFFSLVLLFYRFVI